MKGIKDELQNIILRDEQIGPGSQLKKVQNFLRIYAETSIATKEQQRFKDQETAALIAFTQYWRKYVRRLECKGYLCL